MKKIKYIIFLAVIGIVVFLLYNNKSPKVDDSWITGNYGDIIETESEDEQEIIPPNIFDSFDIEYEYFKIPSKGMALYVPVDWQVRKEDDYIYLTAKEDNELYDKFKNIEIGICTYNIETNDFSSQRYLLGINNYINKNLSFHIQGKTLKAFVTNQMDLQPVYDESKTVYKTYINSEYYEYNEPPQNTTAYTEGHPLIGYHTNPEIIFVQESNVINNLTPYTSLYYCKPSDHPSVTAVTVVGPHGSSELIDEIAKTVATNMSEVKIDYKENKRNGYSGIKMVLTEMNGFMFYYPETVGGIRYNGSSYLGCLSDDPNHLAYNSYYTIQAIPYDVDKNGPLENIITKEFAFGYLSSINTKMSQHMTQAKKGFDSLKLTINEVENVELAGTLAVKVQYKLSANYSDGIRNYLYGYSPINYTSYIIQGNKKAYIMTVNYTPYQRYYAEKFIEESSARTGFK